MASREPRRRRCWNYGQAWGITRVPVTFWLLRASSPKPSRIWNQEATLTPARNIRKKASEIHRAWSRTGTPWGSGGFVSHPNSVTQNCTGRLEITRLAHDREQGDDVLVFDPTRVTDGIELSDDPILRFRTHAYAESVLRRTGVARA